LSCEEDGPAKLQAIAGPSCRASHIGNMPGIIDEARLGAALQRADATAAARSSV
jgi:hypothetical protein